MVISVRCDLVSLQATRCDDEVSRRKWLNRTKTSKTLHDRRHCLNGQRTFAMPPTTAEIDILL